jgi:hypothetical protein
MSPTIFAVMGVLISLAALGLLVGGIVTYVRQRRKYAGRVATTGTIVDLVHRITTSGRSGVNCPVVEFQTPSGATVRFESVYSTQPASHKVGQTVKVLYDTANPQQAEIDSVFSRMLVPGILSCIGLIFLCLAVFFTGFYYLILYSGQ